MPQRRLKGSEPVARRPEQVLEGELLATDIDPHRQLAWPGIKASAGAWGSRPANWFQMGMHSPGASSGAEIASIYACQATIAESVAPVRLRHVRRENGVLVEIPNSRFAQLLARPNHYQSGLEFRLYQMFALLSDGNAYAWAERDSVGRAVALHPIDPSNVQVLHEPGSGEYFYSAPVSQTDLVMRPQMIPARDVWHLRARTKHDPMVGLSPLVSTYYVQIIQSEIQATSAEFYQNKARPGGLLKTAKDLRPEQAAAYLAAWERAAQEGFRGKTAILDRGLEYADLSMSAADADLVATYNLTVEEIARAFGVPGWMIGLGDPSYSNAETMDRAFHARTLRFYFDLIEAGLTKFFRLPFDQAIDHAVEERMAKTDVAAQLEGLRTGVQGGILTSNEARRRLNLPPVEEGDELLVQQQMVPLSRALEEPEPAPVPAIEPQIPPVPLREAES